MSVQVIFFTECAHESMQVKPRFEREHFFFTITYDKWNLEDYFKCKFIEKKCNVCTYIMVRNWKFYTYSYLRKYGFENVMSECFDGENTAF